MTKKGISTKEDIEKYYNKCRKIRFNFDVEIKNLNDILDKMLYVKTPSLNTIYVKGGHHCYPSKYRSIDDIIKVSKFYFHDVTIKEVLDAIIKYEGTLEPEMNYYSSATRPAYLNFRYCPTIKKSNIAGKTSYADQFKKSITSYLGEFRLQGFNECINIKLSDFLK